MSQTTIVQIIEYHHKYAAVPWLERFVDCPLKGGQGNTKLEACQVCDRHRGFGKNKGSGNDNILCRTEVKLGNRKEGENE
jgi:hypothetical protein